MKICRVCKRELPEEMFQKDPKNKDGLKGSCKDCTKEYRKKYNAFQKERRKNAKGLEKAQKEAEYLLGGMKIYVLNYASKKEFKFNIINTNGETFNTNDSYKFFNYLRRKI